jgi:hypothetical protein
VIWSANDPEAARKMMQVPDRIFIPPCYSSRLR